MDVDEDLLTVVVGRAVNRPSLVVELVVHPPIDLHGEEVAVLVEGELRLATSEVPDRVALGVVRDRDGHAVLRRGVGLVQVVELGEGPAARLHLRDVPGPVLVDSHVAVGPDAARDRPVRVVGVLDGEMVSGHVSRAGAIAVVVERRERPAVRRDHLGDDPGLVIRDQGAVRVLPDGETVVLVRDMDGLTVLRRKVWPVERVEVRVDPLVGG